MKRLSKPLPELAIACAFAPANVNHAKANSGPAPYSLTVTTLAAFEKALESGAPAWYVLFGSGWAFIVPGK